MRGRRKRTERVPQDSAITDVSINEANIEALCSGLGVVKAIKEPFPRTLVKAPVSFPMFRKPVIT